MAERIWVTVDISLRIQANKINVANLEELLGIIHSRFVRKGSKRIKSWPGAGLDTWGYEIFKGEATDLDVAIKKVVELMVSRKEAFQAVSGNLGYQLQLYLSYHSSLAQGGFQLPPDFLRIVGEAGLSLIVSIFSWGGVEGAPVKGKDKES